MKKILTASCLCKGIKFKTSGEHRNVSNCHCIHGSYSNVKDKDIKFITKNTLKWFNSSSSAKRGFCNKCGASVFFKFKNSDNTSIAAGMFNGKTGLKTMRNIFVGSKSDFYKISDKLPKYKRFSN